MTRTSRMVVFAVRDCTWTRRCETEISSGDCMLVEWIRRFSKVWCYGLLVVCLMAGMQLSVAKAQSRALGVFDGQSDVGAVEPAGTAVFDPAAKTYTLTAAGANLWMTTDAFHFVWKK